MDQAKRETSAGIDIGVERVLLLGSLARLDMLVETECVKQAKQCLRAVIGWLERDQRESISQVT